MTTKPNKYPQGYHGWLMLDGEQGSNVLKDALNNLAPNATKIPVYAQGLLVGIVSAFVATGMDFHDALQLAWQHFPDRINRDAIPEDWQVHLNIKKD